MRTHLTILAFLAVAALSFYGVGEFAKNIQDVSRFPEKPPLNYTVLELRNFATKETDAAKRYVIPVLIPLDLFVMILLGGSMAVASLFWAHAAGVPAGILWIVLLLPVGYVTADLAEDSLLVLMLTNPETITDTLASVLKGLTIAKLGCVLAAMVQTVVLLVWAAGKAIVGAM